MATHRVPMEIVRPDANVPMDLIANQITAATSPSLGDLDCYVLADGGVDEGVYVRLQTVPKNYVGTPKVIIRGYLDGAPGAGDDLGFGFRKKAVADNEAGDATFDAEQTAQNTDIGSTGSNYSNEDFLEMAITLTAGDYAVDDEVQGYAYIDASGTTFAGNFLLTSVLFEYTDT